MKRSRTRTKSPLFASSVAHSIACPASPSLLLRLLLVSVPRASERARAYDFVKTVALSTDSRIAELEFRNDLACRQKEGLILLYLNSTLGEL